MSANNFLYGNGKERLLGTSSSIDLDDAETIATSKAVYELNKKIETTGKLPLGHFFLHPFPTPPDGCLVVNGSEYNRELYKDLWVDVQIKGQYKTEAEWQQIASANGGYCPWYSDGDGTTTFRTPKFAPYQKIALASGDVGTYYGAGLPNIEGKTGATSDTNLYLSGCCYAAEDGNRVGVYNTASTSNKALALDASLSNPIYGNSTTVQPESHDWIVCVVAFGTATNVGEVDVANVMSAVGQVQADLVNLESNINKQTMYKKIAERSSTGNWTITGCTIGRPLKVYLTYPNVDDYSEVDLTVISGSDVAKMSRPFAIGYGGNWASTDIFEVIPTAATVVIEVGGSISSTGKLLAYN